MSVIPFPVARTERRAKSVRPTAPLLAIWLRRIRQRRDLAALDLGQLREAGLDPFRVRAEAVKPFWRP